MRRYLGSYGLFLVAWLFTPWVARAQAPENRGPSEEVRNQSHVPIEFEGRDFNEALLQRFGNLHQTAEERDQWIKRARAMADKFQKNPKDPEIERIARELLQDQRAGDWLQQELNAQKKSIPPGSLKELQERLKNFQGKSMAPGANGGVPLAGQGAAPQDPGKTNTPEKGGPREQESMAPGGPPMGMMGGFRPPPQSDQPRPEKRLTDWLRKNLDVNQGPLADSQAIREAVRELRKSRSDPEPAADDKSWIGQIAHFSQSLGKNDLLSKVEWPKLGKWQMPTSRSLPKVHSRWAAPSFEKMPTVGLPSATTIDRGLQFLWVALIVAAGLLVWKLLGGYVPGVGRQRKRDWKLGPWPVAPGAVGTRQDLVRAFEYLSLLKLGPAAQSRNHHDLAAELGEPEAESRGAAERLASLYEKARYTPPEEILSDNALASARRELCFLAGTKSA
jgi:hypothetical protein